MEGFTFDAAGKTSFIELALMQGVPVQVSPGLTCSEAHPHPCLERVPRVWISLHDEDWIIHNPLCLKHAKEAASLYGAELLEESEDVSPSPFQNGDEAQKFVEAAYSDGIAVQILPGLACSVTHPEDCLRKVTRIRLFLEEESERWIVRAPLCAVHAKEALVPYDPRTFREQESTD